MDYCRDEDRGPQSETTQPFLREIGDVFSEVRLIENNCFRQIPPQTGRLVVVICHNVLPHDPVFDDDVRARRMLVDACDLVIVHAGHALDALAS